jgi:hypothetical protein
VGTYLNSTRGVQKYGSANSETATWKFRASARFQHVSFEIRSNDTHQETPYCTTPRRNGVGDLSDGSEHEIAGRFTRGKQCHYKAGDYAGVGLVWLIPVASARRCKKGEEQCCGKRTPDLWINRSLPQQRRHRRCFLEHDRCFGEVCHKDTQERTSRENCPGHRRYSVIVEFGVSSRRTTCQIIYLERLPNILGRKIATGAAPIPRAATAEAA